MSPWPPSYTYGRWFDDSGLSPLISIVTGVSERDFTIDYAFSKSF